MSVSVVLKVILLVIRLVEVEVTALADPELLEGLSSPRLIRDPMTFPDKLTFSLLSLVGMVSTEPWSFDIALSSSSSLPEVSEAGGDLITEVKRMLPRAASAGCGLW